MFSFGQDSSGVHFPKRIVGSDSAVIASPVHHSILKGQPVLLTVIPRCPVSRVDLIVHYFPGRADTLARLTTPPYSIPWDYSAVPDQDQLHLQFGYVLYHVNGDTIVSSPTPHHWIIDRKTIPSRKKYVCSQVAPAKEFVIDGKLDDWKRFRQVHFPAGGGFRCSWTPANFYCAVEVYDPIVTPGDRVELCLDLMRSRTQFMDIQHRLISFGPQSRSFSWAVDLSDTGAVQVDSIIVRIKEEMEWRSQLTSTGYIIEARVPFCILSTLEFPPKKFGFDIAVVNTDNAGIRDAKVYSWSNAEPGARHTPAEWGTIVLRQRFLPLKMVLVFTMMVCAAIILMMIFLLFFRKRKDSLYERMMQKKISPSLQKITTCIEEQYRQFNLNTAGVAQESGQEIAEVERLFREELATTCDNYITVVRIKNAKQLLAQTEKTIDEVMRATGFSEKQVFVTEFTAIAGVSPMEWRDNRLKDNLEEEDEQQ